MKMDRFPITKTITLGFFPLTNKTEKLFPWRQISELLITGNDLFSISASLPSLQAGVTQGNNELSGKG